MSSRSPIDPDRLRGPSGSGSGPDGASPGGEPPGEVGQILRRGLKSALARWVILKRRGYRPTPPPTHKDEATHRWDGHPQFAEDYTFAGAQAGLGVVVRLAWLPGRDSQRIWVAILRPDGVWALRGGQRLLRTVSSNRWRAGGVQLDCQVPFREWTLQFEGALTRQGHATDSPALRLVSDGDDTTVRARIDLTFMSTASPYTPGADDDPELLARRLGEASWDTRLLRAARRSIPEGYVQHGDLVGTIAVGEVLVPVRAAALRQHRWGVFDWAACDDAYQCFWSTEDGRRGWVHHTRMEPMTFDGGFMTQRGHVEPIRALASTFEWRPQRAPVRFGLTFGDAEGPDSVEAEAVCELGFVVDGRGRVDLSLVRIAGPTPGWGLWAGLRRAPGREW